jgi:hypothetical protein
MPRTLRETYFDPDYIEIKYITEDTTLYALKLHGYISRLLENRLESFTTIGEVIDTPMSELRAELKFGARSQKELTAFFIENLDKFRLKGPKPVLKKKQSCEKKIKVLEAKLKKMEVFRTESIKQKKANETLKKGINIMKEDYDNYYKARIKNLNDKINALTAIKNKT